MRKLLILIVILIFLNIFAFNYLENSINTQKEYRFNINKQQFIIQKKDLILDEDNDFIFDEYFAILSLNKPQYKYDIDDKNIHVTIANKKLSYPYSIKEKEVIEVEKVITQNIPVYIPQYINSDNNVVNTSQSNNPYFSVVNSYYSFSKETDINHIISVIRNAVDTNQEVTIDFSSLNPNESGIYNVYFYTDSNSASINVEIIWSEILS